MLQFVNILQGRGKYGSIIISRCCLADDLRVNSFILLFFKKSFHWRFFQSLQINLAVNGKDTADCPGFVHVFSALSCSSLSQKEGMRYGRPLKSLNISCKLLLLETHSGLFSESLLISQNLICSQTVWSLCSWLCRHKILLCGWLVGMMIPEGLLVSQQMPGAHHCQIPKTCDLPWPAGRGLAFFREPQIGH